MMANAQGSHFLRNTVLAAVILMMGVGGGYYILNSAPKPGRVKAEIPARLVDVTPLKQESSRPYWQTGGVVSAADAVSLAPQVSGRVEWINPLAEPGALLAKGAVLARLEAADFDLQVAQAQAALTQAQADLALEQGQAQLAAEEYAMAASELSEQERALVLRKPQLASAQAAVAVAQANLRQAQLDQSRRELKMPFAGRISSRAVSVGSYVSATTTTFALVGTERVWIEVRIPRTFLTWLDLQGDVPLTMASVAGERTARIVNVLPDVADNDRQARVMLQLNNPMAEGQMAVLVNDYVNVQLPGHAIAATVIESRLLNDDGSVWVVNDNKLYRRTPQVIFRGRERAWLGEGFNSGDQLLLNRIDSVTDGMPVRTRQSGGVAL